MRNSRTGAACSAATLIFVAMAACVDTGRELSIGDDCDGSFCHTDAFVPFNLPSDEGGDGSSPVIDYCPSAKCPEGYTTCPGSRFPCDVNLKTDRNNCGACGSTCPARQDESFACNEGRCVMTCMSFPMKFDCDGIVDNGCETPGNTNDNCTACGDTCLDPANPCVQRAPFEFGCGCLGGFMACADPFLRCVDTKKDDTNCGTCGKACDPTGDGGVPPDNAYFGCDKGECGAIKCRNAFGDCDLNHKNGCETPLTTSRNCGVCGNACDPGQECRPNEIGMLQCMCPAGQTYCTLLRLNDEPLFGKCVDVTTDVDHCGACGAMCPGKYAFYSTSVCTYGTCSRQCVVGRADCNGNPSDDCETDINSDPRNCGGCGNACDAIAGQACVAGRCVVEPCADDAGVGAR
jgi:hypothetical protein